MAEGQSSAAPAAGASRILIRAVRDALRTVREPERAAGQQRYMKSTMPFMGVRVPVMRKTARAVFGSHPPRSGAQWQATVRTLWREARFRELRYAAIELLVHPPCLPWLTMDRVPLVDELVVDGAWWDYVDRIAPAGLGHLVTVHPAPAGALMRAWARDENVWRRRAAILCQLGFKEETDLELLHDCLSPSFGHGEFFVRKAMGWALRAHAWTDPRWVQRYVAEHENELSKLTRREALKNVG